MILVLDKRGKMALVGWLNIGFNLDYVVRLNAFIVACIIVADEEMFADRLLLSVVERTKNNCDGNGCVIGGFCFVILASG